MCDFAAENSENDATVPYDCSEWAGTPFDLPLAQPTLRLVSAQAQTERQGSMQQKSATVGDLFDAMRAGIPEKELHGHLGCEFHPDLLDTFLWSLHRGSFPHEMSLSDAVRSAHDWAMRDAGIGRFAARAAGVSAIVFAFGAAGETYAPRRDEDGSPLHIDLPEYSTQSGPLGTLYANAATGSTGASVPVLSESFSEYVYPWSVRRR
jgi:hypothetical protein